jgi:uncharacterized coiled-coil protein SlyX
MTEFDERIAVCETKIDEQEEEIKTINQNVYTIMNNHLPHIKDSISELKLSLSKWAVGILSSLVISMVLMIFNLIKK